MGNFLGRFDHFVGTMRSTNPGFLFFSMCSHSRTALIFDMGQKPKRSTQLKVYYELTFVSLGHLQELV